MERMMRQNQPYHVRSGIGSLCLKLSLLVLPIILALFMSCSAPQVQKSQTKGVYHVVKKGETVYSIARAYSISLQDVAEINNISDVSSLKEGMVIFIPDANQVIDDVMTQAGKSGVDLKRELPESEKPSQPHDNGKTAEKQPLTEKAPPSKPVRPESPGAESSGAVAPPRGDKPFAPESQEIVKLEKGKFAWPVNGVVKTRFGIQPNKPYHNNSWVKIACAEGAKVRAAASGTVIFSAGLKDFGETVIIRHSNDFATVYTHLKKRSVKQDQRVKKGEIIALAGEKDEGGEAYIHFEVRHKGKARNPLFYLP